jgi:hypothetical protein
LLGWWRELARWNPQQLGFAHLEVQRVEALVGVTRPIDLGPLESALLESVVRGAEATAADLHLDPALLTALLRDLAERGLLEPAGSAPAGRPAWMPTDAGREAARSGTAGPTRERMAFHFAPGLAGRREPHYLPLEGWRIGNPPPAGLAAEGGRFDLLLEECIRQPAEWKARFGFPAEVREVHASAQGGPVSDPHSVMLACRARLLLVLIEVAGEPGCAGLLGFAVRADGWALEGEAPVLSLREGWRELFPEMAGPLPEETWRAAWRSWCQQRILPPSEVEACRLEPAGHRLRVHAPARLVARLRNARSDAMKGEAWLLAETGSVRPAALLEVVEG